jgi:hypothetical protein
MNDKIQERALPKNSMKKTLGVARPGYGTDEIPLGLTENQVKAVLGRPDHRIRKHTGHYFYVYNKKGLDLDFGKRGGKLKVIFFFQKGVYGHDKARIQTDRGIRLGDSRSRVLEIYGQPDHKGEAFTLHTGKTFLEWFYYNVGIQFRFSVDNKVCEISLSRKKK